jgi:hypothetical protein
LGSIGSFASGGTPSKDNPDYWNGNIPWVSASSMYDLVIEKADHYVTPLAIGKGTRIAKKGSILILVRGSMLFKRVPICIAGIDVAFNQDVKALVVDASLDTSFLLYQLSAFQSRFPINETGIGAGKIELDHLKGFELFIPKLQEQQRIASCLTTLDALITAETQKLYTTEDGRSQIKLRAQEQTVWLTQLEMAELFDATKQNISLHLKNVFEDGELDADSVVKESLTTAADGKRYQTLLYNLDAILAVGYRVRSPRGVQFRRWASTVLKEYLVKGFVMDDERLKNPDGRPDYFDEMLERIRDIRASEKRFYQKVRDLFALSTDYDKTDKATQVFFATVQNLLLFAVTQQTAAELITARANPDDPHFGLLAWKGDKVRKADIVVAKNYLTEDEIDTLNRLVVIFLETAELRAKSKQVTRMAFWKQNVDQIITSNGFPLLTHAGMVSHEEMEARTGELYLKFDQDRKRQEAIQADQQDEADLRALETKIKRRPKK